MNCPRCGRVLGENAVPSLWDEETEICSACGWEERVILHWGSTASLNPETGMRPWVWREQ